MKLLKRMLSLVIVLLVVAVALAYITGNTHVLYGLPSTYFSGKSKPDIDDMSFFNVRTIPADKPEPLPQHRLYNAFVFADSTEAFAKQMNSTAFIVLKNDSILFEKYWNDGGTDVTSNSFSMAKTYCAMLIGIAIEEGYLKSVDQKVTEIIPELEGEFASSLTIKNLLQMSSGIPFGESYASPFGFMAKAYFGKDLISETLKFKVDQMPGTGWVYEGGNTVLLGLILKRATGRNVADYFHQKIWSCIGAEKDAYWNLDKLDGMEKTFSGVYATAKDYAKMALLFNHKGVIGNDTIISPLFIEEMIQPCMIKDISPKNTGEMCYWYGYQTWLGTHKGLPFVCIRGLRGQYVVAFPELQMVMVRLGHDQSAEREDHMPLDMMKWMDVALQAATFAP